MDKTDNRITNVKTETFQEIGFFGEVMENQWNGFVQAVQNNIHHSRRERGNISFSLYQPADGQLRPIWFERFKTKADHNYHKEQDYFKNAISVIQRSLAGEAKSVTLRELDATPVTPAATGDSAGGSRHVITLFHVHRDKTTDFIKAMASVMEMYRTAAGNLEYNLYGYADDPDKFVLIEGWQTLSHYEAQLNKEPVKTLEAQIGTFLSTDPKESRWIVKDISR